MLQETKKALRISASVYDSELMELIIAGSRDLQLAGIQFKGFAKYTVAQNGTVTDSSTITDPLIKRAIITYVRLRFGSPDDYDRLKAAYDEQKAQLITAEGYGIEQEETCEW